MTFSEYFNGLYYPLKNEEKKAEFFDKMISHFIDEDACKDCTLLHVDPETKPRYVKENKPNPVKADNAIATQIITQTSKKQTILHNQKRKFF